MKTIKVTIYEDQYTDEVLKALQGIPSITIESLEEGVQQAIRQMQSIIREHPKVDIEEDELQDFIQKEINAVRQEQSK